MGGKTVICIFDPIFHYFPFLEGISHCFIACFLGNALYNKIIAFSGRVKDRRSLQVRASTLRGDIKMLRADLNKLKLLQTFQAQQFDEMMRQAKERLVQQVSRISQGIEISVTLKKILMTVRVIIIVYRA